jgi:small subunit ribosomal protein S6
MRRYELMVILDPDLEEKTVAPSLETYLKIIKEGGGKVNKLDKRRMSFEINKKGEGIYAVIDMQSEPAPVKELDRQLNLNESVLRTKVVRPE